MFGSLGFTELILILMIVLIIFGAGKLPQLGEGVGKAIKGFKKSVQEAEAYDVEPQAQTETPASTAQITNSPPIPQSLDTAARGAGANLQSDPVHSGHEPVAAQSKA